MKAVLFLMFLGVVSCKPQENSYLSSGPTGNVSLDAIAEASVAFRQQQSSSDIKSTKKVIPIVKFAQDNDGQGSYNFNYEGANGIVAEETGDAKGDGTKAHGSYSFTLPDGQHVSVTYTADENGFVAQGSHIPAIPDAILKALEQNAAAEARGIFDDGQYHGEGLEESQYKEKLE